MGLPGKPDGIDGAEVAQYHREGRIQDIAEYCESDVVNTYRVWLRYELLRGKLTESELDANEANLVEYIKAHSNSKPHLMEYLGAAVAPASPVLAHRQPLAISRGYPIIASLNYALAT
jgi:3'-5' exonuclease